MVVVVENVVVAVVFATFNIPANVSNVKGIGSSNICLHITQFLISWLHAAVVVLVILLLKLLVPIKILR